jgi:translation initiation factor 3 subunit F
LPPLATLSESLAQLSNQLETIQAHVASINQGTNSSPADPEVGRYLLEAVGRWKADASAAAAAEEGGEQGVKKGLQELLSVSYLSTLLRSQVELSARLNLLT